MELKLAGADLDRFLKGTATVMGREIPIWPEPAKVHELGDPRIFAVRFPDDDLLREEMIRAVLDEDSGRPENVVGYGGNKVRTAKAWNSPVGKLLTLRALLFFNRTQGAGETHTVDRWANVSLAGDYSAPHAHYESEVAAVYFLDLGDPDPDPRAPLSGRFELIDPRIPWCCSTRPECPTCGLMPEIEPGVMILFPASILHFVHPYSGSRPRITLAWNLSSGPEPPGNEEKMTQLVPGKIGPAESRSE